MAVQIKSPEYLSIDINQGKVRKAICVNQNDSVNRTIMARITDSGAALDLENLLFAEILIAKADGFEADQGCVIDGSTIMYTLKSTDISALGTNTAQFLLTFNDGTVLTTPTFEINVYAKVLNPQVQKSTNEYGSLTQQVVLASEYRTQAEEAANKAVESLSNIKDSEVNAKNSADAAAVSEANTKASEINASISEANAKASEETSSNIMSSVTQLSANVTEMKNTTEGYMNAALSSENNAAVSEANAKASEEIALNAKTSALTSETNAKASAESANSSYLSSRSYAVGDTGTRAGEELDNAKYYFEQARTVVKSGGLTPMGTCIFVNLPTKDVQIGDMYNISDSFVSDERFKDGAGIEYQEGSDVYFTADGMWDVMSPNMSNYLLRQGDSMSNTVTFTDATEILDLNSGETHSTLFGKISASLKNLINRAETTDTAIGDLKAKDAEIEKEITDVVDTAITSISSELNAHATNTDIHITAAERTAWNNVITQCKYPS